MANLKRRRVKEYVEKELVAKLTIEFINAVKLLQYAKEAIDFLIERVIEKDENVSPILLFRSMIDKYDLRYQSLKEDGYIFDLHEIKVKDTGEEFYISLIFEGNEKNDKVLIKKLLDIFIDISPGKKKRCLKCMD